MATYHILFFANLVYRAGVSRHGPRMNCTDGARPSVEASVHAETSHDRATPEEITSPEYHPRQWKHIARINIRNQPFEPNSIHALCRKCQCASHRWCFWSVNLAIDPKWAGRFFGVVRAMCFLDNDVLDIGLSGHRHRVHG